MTQSFCLFVLSVLGTLGNQQSVAQTWAVVYRQLSEKQAVPLNAQELEIRQYLQSLQ